MPRGSSRKCPGACTCLRHTRSGNRSPREKLYPDGWGRAHLEYFREYNVTRRHGITRKQRDKLYQDQGGRCAGCLTSYPDADLEIDHDHNHCSGVTSCGRCIRGLVCHGCNVTDRLARAPG